VGRPRRLWTFCGLLVALSAGRPLGAQYRAALDVGLSAVRFPEDSVQALGPFASWTIARNAARSFLSGSLGGVLAGSGGSGSAELSAGRRAMLAGGWVGEASAELGALAGPERRLATSALAAGRLLRPFAEGGGWLRASGDVAGREAGRLGGHGVDAGAWWQWPRAQLTASLAAQWNTAQLFAGPSRGTLVGTVPVRYTEGALSLRVEGDAARLELAAALRRDIGAPELYSPAVNVTAALWQSPTHAFVVSLARQLPDFVHGGDAVDYISVGMRFNEPTPRAERDARARPTIQVSGDDSLHLLTVRAPTARTVELMADFTGWEPIRLTRRNGSFVRAVALTSGTHRVVVRIDGGAWMPAANTPAVDDDFGGRVGLLLVP
jgi:hypothetical protein